MQANISRGTLNYFMSLVAQDMKRDTQEMKSILRCNGYRENAATEILRESIDQHKQKYNDIMLLVDSQELSVIVVTEEN